MDESFAGGSSLDLVTTREQLAASLREVHARADRPSLRSLERWARTAGRPALSRSTVAGMLSGRRFANLTVLVTFVEACGVPVDQITPWHRAWERVAAGDRAAAAEVNGLRRRVLADAEAQAAAIVARARAEADEIVARAREHTQAVREPFGAGRAPIMVLNERWYLYASLNADSSGMATLYRAYERADPGRTVVAKVFHQAQNDPQRFRTFLREVRGMRLSNPHIGEIIDSGRDEKSKAVYLISPLYLPGSLNLHVQGQPGVGAPLRWSLWVVDQVLAGLEAAARSNMIHLDIKPQNIVLDGPSNIRIIDWGMSQLHEAGRSVSTVFPGGTKWFASPEQLGYTSAAPSSLSDLYGVGALAYWLLTGAAPLRRQAGTDDAGLVEVLHLMQAGVRPERADLAVPGVPAHVGRLIDRWLSYDPVERAPEGMGPSAALGWARLELG
ncbi:protein kinase domain-containing protein [Sphaerisporangium aureirubrum]|uniref:Protein kinase n=1 Tax=Sphaerisporangium aureirubrum TaxID=1544736 RepID=A0ABW1NCW2_9ACTN